MFLAGSGRNRKRRVSKTALSAKLALGSRSGQPAGKTTGARLRTPLNRDAITAALESGQNIGSKILPFMNSNIKFEPSRSNYSLQKPFYPISD